MAKLIKFPRVPIPKPTRPHLSKHKRLPREAKHKEKPDASGERCLGCGQELATAGVINDGCKLCAPFMWGHHNINMKGLMP